MVPGALVWLSLTLRERSKALCAQGLAALRLEDEAAALARREGGVGLELSNRAVPVVAAVPEALRGLLRRTFGKRVGLGRTLSEVAGLEGLGTTIGRRGAFDECVVLGRSFGRERGGRLAGGEGGRRRVGVLLGDRRGRVGRGLLGTGAGVVAQHALALAAAAALSSAVTVSVMTTLAVASVAVATVGAFELVV